MVLAHLLTPAEAAAYLRVSRVTVYREIQRGRLGHCRVGEQVRITEDDLTTYLERTRSTGPPSHDRVRRTRGR